MCDVLPFIYSRSQAFTKFTQLSARDKRMRQGYKVKKRSAAMLAVKRSAGVTPVVNEVSKLMSTLGYQNFKNSKKSRGISSSPPQKN